MKNAVKVTAILGVAIFIFFMIQNHVEEEVQIRVTMHVKHKNPSIHKRICGETDDKSVFVAGHAKGGYNNQREHIINTVLFASLWGVDISEPTARPHDYAGRATRKYWVPPYSYLKPKKSYGMDSLWDKTHFIRSVEAMNICVREKVIPTTQLNGFRDILSKGRNDRELRKSADTYREIKGMSVSDVNVLFNFNKKGQNFSMKQCDTCPVSLCTVVYSRFYDDCKEFGDVCDKALRSLRANSFIRNKAKIIEKDLFGTNWISIHLRTWMCKVTHEQIEWLANVLASAVPDARTLYICSGISPNDPLLQGFRDAGFTLTGKQIAFPNEATEWPFEVRAAVDWEVLLNSPHHFAMDSDSSFTHFLDAYRQLNNNSKVHLLRKPDTIVNGCWGN